MTDASSRPVNPYPITRGMGFSEERLAIAIDDLIEELRTPLPPVEYDGHIGPKTRQVYYTYTKRRTHHATRRHQGR